MSKIVLPIFHRLGSTGAFYLVSGQFTAMVLGVFAGLFADLWAAWKSAEGAMESSPLLTDNFFHNLFS
ncbi:MAG: hypothetical protein GTO40_03230 [Deltaproteobacteria bacterium]|nr:hypothetical protein [Deltaproteobacteria bacterium]